MIKNIILYLFICLSIACAVIIAYKRKTKKGKFLSCLILIFCAAVVLLVNIFPVENLWMKFNNPEEIIEYDKKGTADNIIIGKDSCMIVYSTGNQHNGLYFAPKNENNYILPNFFTKKNIHHDLTISDKLMYIMSQEQMIIMFVISFTDRATRSIFPIR